MSCSTPPVRTIQTGPMVVFSKGGAAPGESDPFIFTPEGIEDIAPMLKEVRVTVIFLNASQNVQVKPVFLPSDNGNTWGTPIDLDGYLSATKTSDYYTTVSNFKRALKFGVLVKQSTGTNVEMANIVLVFDFVLRS